MIGDVMMDHSWCLARMRKPGFEHISTNAVTENEAGVEGLKQWFY
jgi:hypothetical protein